MTFPLKSSALLCAFLLLFLPCRAQKEGHEVHTGVRHATDALCLLPALSGGAMAIVKRDGNGLQQLALSEASTILLNYALELSIRKERPDHTGHHAFPSTHTAVAFSGAAFLQKRYGAKVGIPAFAVATAVGAGRIYCKKHDLWDVLAGAAIGTASSLVFTKQYSPRTHLTTLPFATSEGTMGLCATLTF